MFVANERREGTLKERECIEKSLQVGAQKQKISIDINYFSDQK